ncbi:ABC-three component system protein [Hymenobacter sp.]|jgi:hypothetical protein|uniref:ABC-three component system protein n=1 Tax=Hymenobacter sp. TaxID=1898978 RepID=UPI002ED7A72B
MAKLFDSTHQTNIGSNNINAAPNANVSVQVLPPPHPLQFDPEDLRHVIECFSDNLDEAATRLEDLVNIDKAVKNELNGLTDEYFECLTDRLMPYLDQIRIFLVDHKNQSLRKKYQETVLVLKTRIIANRKHFSSFDEVMEHLAQDIYKQCKHHRGVSMLLVSVFLDYMYFTCDIGKTK